MKQYDFSKVEKKWIKAWREAGIYEPDLLNAKEPFYNLMMFPYPSAEGLHVGNMYAFTGSDIYGRFKRMQGYDVFEPIGLDGFGIHSENYALKIGTHPLVQSKVSEERFYKQLEVVGNGFAWNERLETYDPEYYRWTQWIFVQMWKHGLAYRKRQSVNWCPSCKTVLADEQVIDGKCERCGTAVVKKEMEQWFFRITEYAERLLENLDAIDWSEKVKIAQRNWIGRSKGTLVDFKVEGADRTIRVFTTRVDTLFSGAFVVLAPEHEIISSLKDQISNLKEVEEYIARSKKKSEEERTTEEREKTGVELKGVKAVSPANGERLPVWVADFVLGGYGTGAVFADAHDERDFALAKKYGIPLKVSLVPADGTDVRKVKDLETCFTGDGVLCNSGEFDGMTSADARVAITEWLAKRGSGEAKTTYRLRDWLISRQRYWGPPIPMVHCAACAAAGKGEQKGMPGWYAVSEEDLPVKLPMVKDFRPQGKGESPLASVREFYETKCPACGGPARRETDVSDTFLDSAWYYLRYPSVNAATAGQAPWDPEIIKRWFPVNMYIGGAEHSVLHLLYVRFVALALRDMKLLDIPSATGEPFPKFRAHGLVIKDGAKMSKSKGNVVNPDEYVKKFGADALRMYLMFLAPFEQGGDFRDQGMLGIERFLRRTRELGGRVGSKGNEDAERKLHGTIKKVTEDIEGLHYNTAISALMILLNEFETALSISVEQYGTFLKLLAPFAPFLTEEMWQILIDDEKRKTNNSGFQSIHKEKWPEYDPKLLIADSFTLVVQVNGKVRDQFEVAVGIVQKEAEEKALAREKVRNHLNGKTPKKVIYVPGRLVNFVV